MTLINQHLNQQHLNRPQRDLVWCIQQPGLIRADELWPADDWFANQTVDVIEDLTPPPARFRLGIHFEKLLQRWLETQQSYQIAAANLQVHGEGKTLGEFDLIVDGPSGFEHWELAVKFYINVNNHQDAANWFGPDPGDTLHSKLSRLLSHQLNLPLEPVAAALLDSMAIKLSSQRCIMKGRLYHPWDAFHAGRLETPSIVNPNHPSGWWLDSAQLDPLADKRMVYLDKALWLSELLAEDVNEVLDLEGLTERLQQSKQIALQFAILDGENNEASRGFVLQPEWFRRAVR